MNLAVIDGLEVVRVEGDPGARFAAGSISKPVAALTVTPQKSYALHGGGTGIVAQQAGATPEFFRRIAGAVEGVAV